MDTLEKGLAKVLREELGLKTVPTAAIVEVLKYLDSQGVVRKVDSKRIPVLSRFTDRENMRRLDKEGWSKTERLIDATI